MKKEWIFTDDSRGLESIVEGTLLQPSGRQSSWGNGSVANVLGACA